MSIYNAESPIDYNVDRTPVGVTLPDVCCDEKPAGMTSDDLSKIVDVVIEKQQNECSGCGNLVNP